MAEVRELEKKQPSSYWLDPANMRREILVAEEQRNRLLSQYKEMISKYEGPGRNQDLGNGYDRENHYFEWISLVLPQLLFQNPKCRVGSKRSSVAKWDALACDHAINRWIVDTDYKRYLERVGLDWCFMYGVGMTTIETYGDFDDPKHRPRTLHLDPEQFGMDSLARSWEDSRFMFHKCAERKVELLSRAKSEDGWYVEKIKDLATEQEVQGLGRPKSDISRDEVAYWEVWVPALNEDDDDEYHGKILTLGTISGPQGLAGSEIRKPRRYYGPRWGPYTIFGSYSVPRSAYPMGPLQAHEGHNRELNLHAQANSLSASRRKTNLVYDETDSTTAAKVLNAKDGEGIGIPGFEKSKFDVFQTPGVTEDALVYEQWKRGALERISGLNDRAKGETANGATATADAIAARGSNARMGWLEQKMYEAVQRQLRTVLWFYWHDDQIEEELGPEYEDQAAKLGAPIPELEGNETRAMRGGFDGSFDDLELIVEPYSMQRTDEAGMQARSMQSFQLIAQVAPLIPQTPWIDWMTLLDKFGQVMNWPELSEILDGNIAAAVSGMLLQQQQMAAAPQQRPDGPRFSGETGGGKTGPKPSYGAPRMARPAEFGKEAALPGNSSGGMAGSNAMRSM